MDATFDERKFGFASLVDLLRAAQRDGLFRIERDRQGSVRLFPGAGMPTAASTHQPAGVDDDNRGNVAEPGPAVGAEEQEEQPWSPASQPEIDTEPEVVDGAVLQELDVAPIFDAEELPQAAADAGANGRGRRGSRGGRKPQASGRPRKAASKPRTPRASRARKDAPQ